MSKPLLRLAAALGALALVWLVALPRAAKAPAMEARLQWLDEQKVDPSAMYYTELEMMKPILHRLALEQRRRRE